MNEIYRNARYIRVTRESNPFAWNRGHRAILFGYGPMLLFPSVAALKRKVDQLLAERAERAERRAERWERANREGVSS